VSLESLFVDMHDMHKPSQNILKVTKFQNILKVTKFQRGLTVKEFLKFLLSLKTKRPFSKMATLTWH
jgi:hypothetical protein